MFSPVLPIVSHELSAPLVYQEWGTPLHPSDELFSLEELEDFRSTDLDYLSGFGRDKLLVASTSKHTLSQAVESPPAKKRRKIDISALRNIIPRVS